MTKLNDVVEAILTQMDKIEERSVDMHIQQMDMLSRIERLEKNNALIQKALDAALDVLDYITDKPQQ